MNGGEVVVNVMLSRGVDTVFFVPAVPIPPLWNL